jgi:hypothetical protein
MAKISSYGNEGSPKLSDKLIGTSDGGNPVDSTFNFTLQSLLSLFSENITLQDVLNSGNTATQDINLTGKFKISNAVGSVSIGNNSGGTGNQNVAVGAQSLELSSASYNTAIGSFSSTLNVSGQYSSALGYQSLLSNTTGGFNSAFGAQALLSNTTGEFNSAFGFQALSLNTVGGSNVANGFQAGKFTGTGTNNSISNSSVYIGTDSRPLANGENNQIVIGYASIGNGSNTTTIGNSYQTSLYFGGNGAGLVLKSPNGTSYKITVDNSGNLVTTAI